MLCLLSLFVIFVVVLVNLYSVPFLFRYLLFVALKCLPAAPHLRDLLRLSKVLVNDKGRVLCQEVLMMRSSGAVEILLRPLAQGVFKELQRVGQCTIASSCIGMSLNGSWKKCGTIMESSTNSSDPPEICLFWISMEGCLPRQVQPPNPRHQLFPLAG